MGEDVLNLREIILNTRRPIVLKNFKTKWKCSEGTLGDWCQLFDDAQKNAVVEFEQMHKDASTSHPQWERERKTVRMTMLEFLEQHNNKTRDFWTALNYKTPEEIPKACKMGVDFSRFGFPHLTDDYARFWLSSAGSNTPCHQDTYGCNVVVQIFGSKSWLLFPPQTSLTSTRIPYEESSIYCLENFYAPTAKQANDLKRLKNDAYICQLCAGDVLIVPRHWWHYVETGELSLSINAWIPLEIDVEAQLEECIVKYLMENIVRGEDKEARQMLLNPNQENLCAEDEVLSILAFLCAKVDADKDEKSEKIKESSYPYQYLEEESVELLLKTLPYAKAVEKASSSEYEALIAHNAERFVGSATEVDVTSLNGIKQALINSLCCPKVITEIVREFKERNSRNEK